MNKVKNLKKFFKVYGINGYLVPKNDEFFGEYVNKGNDRLNYITSFSGSASLSSSVQPWLSIPTAFGCAPVRR